ncbi:MAG: carbohydrate ABC transporter permease, partial [Solirubrobacteraceae bacterium]
MATADTTIARRRPGATGRRVRRIGARTLLYVIAWVAAIATLVPILYAILGGFRDTGQLSTNPVALPDPWVFSNYSSILKSGTFWHQVWNSVLIALISTGLTVPIAAMA